MRGAMWALIVCAAALTSGASPAAAITTAPSAALTAAPLTALPSVDLVFTGSHPFVAKGSAGKCGDPVSHWFYATEADYPGFGIGFELFFYANGDGDIKWNLDKATAYTDQFPNSAIVLSADKHSVRFDGDLAPSSGTGPEHVSGTIVCP